MRDAIPYIRELIFRREERADEADDFDVRFNVNTAGIVWPWSIDAGCALPRASSAYQTLPTAAIRRILNQIPALDSTYTFVDLGSGKGRVALFASEFEFEKVVGVEIFAQLHEVARENLDQARSLQGRSKIELICMEAEDYKFPANPLVIYLFDPFGERTMRIVLQNLRSSLMELERSVYIVYANPTLAKMFASTPWLSVTIRERRHIIYKVKRDYINDVRVRRRRQTSAGVFD
jgi:predicted RNA methylase